MSQFWQKKQPMLHPAVPIENTLRAGQKMIQRLFLDGINLHRGRMRIPEAVKLSALVRANEAEPRLSLADMAVPRTKVAMHLAVRLSVPPPRFVQLGSLAGTLQGCHLASPLKAIIRLFTRTQEYALAPRALAFRVHIGAARCAPELRLCRGTVRRGGCPAQMLGASRQFEPIWPIEIVTRSCYNCYNNGGGRKW